MFLNFLKKTSTKDQTQFYGFFEPLVKGHNQFIDFENH